MSEARRAWSSRVVSGGQTGVDRAALDVALELGAPCGGWCPSGRAAEDGPIADRYPLRETPSPDTLQRTIWNVRESEATLVLVRGAPSGGTAATIEAAARAGKPLLVVDVAAPLEPQAVRRWAERAAPCVLNVAGPRESECPGIYEEAARFLRRVLEATERGREHGA